MDELEEIDGQIRRFGMAFFVRGVQLMSNASIVCVKRTK